MSPIYSNSKTGKKVCEVNGFRMHSFYDPDNEAKRFIDSLQVSFIPSYFFITGPCFNYCVPYIRQKFPQCSIIAIQYDTCFSNITKFDKQFFFLQDTDYTFFSEQLFAFLGEENFYASFFTSWKPSEQAWPTLANNLWKAIELYSKKSRDIIGTRSFFNKRWLKNILKSIIYVNSISLPVITDKPILVAASGPSLKNSLPYIQKNRDCFYLLAVSSAIFCLVSNHIIPDMCISTDGGYWAKRHLDILVKNKLYDIPLVISAESAIPTELLQKGTIYFLDYQDGIDTIFFLKNNIPTLIGKRNGTVTGTATELALTLTKEKVYLCGLDLCPSKGFNHAEPNELDLENYLLETKLSTNETLFCKSAFFSNSMNIYKNWFSTRDETFYFRVNRLISKKDILPNLGNLKNIIWDNLSLEKKTETQKKIQNQKFLINADLIITFLEESKKQISSISTYKETKIWYSYISLIDYILYKRANKEEKQKLQVVLKTKAEEFLTELLTYAKQVKEHDRKFDI